MRRKTHLQDGVRVCHKEPDMFMSAEGDAGEGEFASSHIQIEIFVKIWICHKGRSDILERILVLNWSLLNRRLLQYLLKSHIQGRFLMFLALSALSLVLPCLHLL